jgi:formamidopyrimidine-DNA glycosylase
MTGQLFGEGASSKRLLRVAERGGTAGFSPDLHTHLQVEFEDGGPRVFFRDVRKFGKVLLVGAGQSDARLDKLGIDALKAEGEHLYEAARARKIPIKTLLLDQGVIAGIGNIYADEALFLADVRPTRAANKVTREECIALVAAAQQVMRRSIQTGGSSISDYVNPDGSDGGYQNERRVYGREGEPCPRCKAAIVRIVIATRSSCYCPNCQR